MLKIPTFPPEGGFQPEIEEIHLPDTHTQKCVLCELNFERIPQSKQFETFLVKLANGSEGWLKLPKGTRAKIDEASKNGITDLDIRKLT